MQKLLKPYEKNQCQEQVCFSFVLDNTNQFKKIINPTCKIFHD